MKTGQAEHTAKLIEAIKPMVELGAGYRRIADTLNRQHLYTPQQKTTWTANTVRMFCTRHAKELSLDDGESLFQTEWRPSEVIDFFPYPHTGPFP